jgi:hypothetical protein
MRNDEWIQAPKLEDIIGDAFDDWELVKIDPRRRWQFWVTGISTLIVEGINCWFFIWVVIELLFKSKIALS